MTSAKSRWAIICAGRAIVSDHPRRIKLRDDAIEALMRGARIAETVTVPGVFLADVCEALVASIPGDVEKCADCGEPFLATARRNGRQVHLCKSHLHRFAIAESAMVRMLETKLASAEAHIAFVTEERERFAAQREEWRARAIANESIDPTSLAGERKRLYDDMRARWRNAEDRLEVANREGERLGEVVMLTTKISDLWQEDSLAKDATIAGLAMVRTETDSEIAKALPSPGERDVLGVAVAGLPADMRPVFTSWLARLDAASDLYRSLAEKLVNLVNKETER